MRYWETIADNLSKAGFSWGCVSAVDGEGRTIWIADAHRGDGQRFVVHAAEKVTAFLELESAIRTAVRWGFLVTESCSRNGFLLLKKRQALFVLFSFFWR
jgi:hypothetical protein